MLSSKKVSRKKSGNKSSIKKLKINNNKKNINVSAINNTRIKNNVSIISVFKFKVVRIILLLFLVLVIGSMLTIFIYNKYNILKYQEIDMSVRVQNGSSSFNTSTEALNFARIYPGGEVVKRIEIYSFKKSFVRIKAEGSIANFISVSENNFIMSENEYKQIEINLVVPADALEGHYDGKLKIYFLRR